MFKFGNKILIISGMFPPASGGPASLLANLMPELIKKGFGITGLTYGGNSADLPYKVVRIPRKGKKIYSFLKLFWTAYKLARNNDQIYTLDVYSTGFSAWVVNKLTGKRLVTRFTGDSAWEIAYNRGWTRDNIVDFQKKFINLRTEFTKWRRNRILKGSDCIITDSYFLKDLLIGFGVRDSKILVVHNSVEYFSPLSDFDLERFKHENNLNEKVVLSVCRLVPWKGVGTVMDLIPELKKTFPSISFVSIGDGPELETLKKKAEQMRNEKGVDVRVLGYLPRKEIIQWYLSSDVYVLNTNYEGIAHTLAEALHFRVPVVTTPAGGTPEIISNEYNGLVVEFDNPEQLKEAIKRILTDKELVFRLKANSEEKLKGDFIWEKVVETNLRALGGDDISSRTNS